MIRRMQPVMNLFIPCALFLSITLAVLPVHASEPSLTEILGNLGFANIVSSSAVTFPSGKYEISLYAEFTQYYDLNELCLYQTGTNNSMPILPGSEGGEGYFSPLTKTFEADSEFGLSLSRNDSLPFMYFTEPARNIGGQQFAAVYNDLDSPSTFLIGFDDRSYCTDLGDYDYNDMVFSLQLQYYLQVISPYATPGGEGWYANGSNAFASLSDHAVNHDNGTRRVFVQWNGDTFGTDYSQSEPIYMNQNKTAVAIWKNQYYLTVKTIPLDLAIIPGQGWYDQYQDVALTAASIPGYNFSYWDVDGTPQANGLITVTVNINTPHTASAHYTKTLTLTITAESGGSTTPPPGTYAADQNSTLEVTANPNADYILDHWELDGTSVGSENPYPVLMNTNHTVRAVFAYSPPPPRFLVTINPTSASINKGQSVKFNSAVSGGDPPYDHQWYLDNNPVLGGTSDSWIAVFAERGIHYVYLKVTDSSSSSAQSSIARIDVAAPPVGGYSVSGGGSEGGESLMLHLTAVVALAAGATAVNRKRKRRTK